ncbi:MAG: hypothetical protein M3345_02305, partial [Actinomycetota bacterium]|nr:hypothetical protein [Actinomycetota bacterium]
MTASYLISGDPFLADEALDRLRRENDFDPLAETVLDASAAAPELMQAVGTGSLLGGQRLVVVNDAQDLKKEQIEALTRYLEAPSPDATLVLVATGRTKLEAAVKKSGTVLALEAPKGRRLATWLRQRASEHKIKIDDRAAWA